MWARILVKLAFKNSKMIPSVRESDLPACHTQTKVRSNRKVACVNKDCPLRACCPFFDDEVYVEDDIAGEVSR